VAERREGLPPAAPLPAALQTFVFWRDPHAYLSWCRSRYGSSFTIRPVGMPPLVFFSALEDIRAIITAPADVLHPGAGGAVISPLVGERSFMLAEEEQHMRGRRAILPAFQTEVVASHRTMVERTVDDELGRWPSNRVLATHPHLRSLTLRVILRTIFGSEDDQTLDLHRALLSMFDVTASLVLHEAPLRHLPGWRRTWRQFLTDRSRVDQLLLGLIEDRMFRRAQDAGLLDLLVDGTRSSGSAGVRQIRDDLMSVILAGHETTASQLAWALQLLAHAPATQQRLAEDLERGEERYLSATVQEVMRHRPVFLFAIPRVTAQPFELGGIVFRAPVHLVGCIHLLHHDPEFFCEPQRFRPERFLELSSEQRARWLPWGGGRKRCPGHRLAMLEMQIVLRAILERWRVLPAATQIERARWRSVIVTPGGGCRVILSRRH
jgi:cytochrome P450